MGACYSRKAGGGKYTYTTVQMASTKLEDSSRLARPTPYCRNTSGAITRKGIPVSTRGEQQLHGNANQPSEIKSSKSASPLPPQSSIPRFNSNAATGVLKGELNENFVSMLGSKNENNELHLVNNNLLPGASPQNRVIEPSVKTNSGKKLNESKSYKLNTSSKISPEQISVQVKLDEKPQSRIPAKVNIVTPGRSFLPQFATRGSPAASANNLECTVEVKSLEKKPKEAKQDALLAGGSDGVLNKCKGNSESHDSIADSGLGNSLTEKFKQEDGDTLKDVERLDSCDDGESPTADKKSSTGSSPSEEKGTVKCPTYKRGINGKWTLEDKNLFGLNKNLVTVDSSLHEKQCQPLKSPHKVSAISSLSSFPTYASYKGMMSYKKYPSKAQSAPCTQPGSKAVTPEKKCITEESSIPKTVAALQNLMSGKNNATKSQCDEDYQQSRSVSEVTSPCPSSKQSSLDPDDKSDGIGSESKSPPSEIENREFLIDDEIADQPSLISFVSGADADGPALSLQQSVTELHALQSLSCSHKKNDGQGGKFRRDRLGSDHRDSLLLSFEMGSSCSSIASDDLMLDFEKKSDFPDGSMIENTTSQTKNAEELDQMTKLSEPDKDVDEKTRKRLYRRSSSSYAGTGGLAKEEWRLRSVSLPLRPPRPMSVSEADDGSIVLDSSSYRLLSQDLTGLKTLLLRLKSVIQEAETINPFDHSNTKNIFYHSLVHSDVPCNMTLLTDEKQENKMNPAALMIENADLRRQLVLLQQQLEEKNRTILLLQQQMTKYTNTAYVKYDDADHTNAATQTERTHSITGSLSSSLENSCETLVSVQDTSEDPLLS